MNKQLFKKCSECGRKMVVKKGGKGRFWACTGYKDGCSTTSEFYGYGSKAGFDLDIRQIENGYVITTFYKYAESVDDEEPSEIYCKDLEELSKSLKESVNSKLEILFERLEQSGQEFANDEEDEKPKLNNRPGSTDINELLKRAKRNRRLAKEMAEKEDQS